MLPLPKHKAASQTRAIRTRRLLEQVIAWQRQ